MEDAPPCGLLLLLGRMVSLAACSQCCCVFSASGICFLVFVGILLQTEPLYIKDVDNPSSAAQQCYIGGACVPPPTRTRRLIVSLTCARQSAGIYAAFVVLSVAGLFHSSKQVRPPLRSAPKLEFTNGRARRIPSLPAKANERRRSR